MLRTAISRHISSKLWNFKFKCVFCSVTSAHYSSDEKKTVTPKAILSKYEAFRDDRAPIILDVEEERRKIMLGLTEPEKDDDYDPFEDISPERGVDGVIEIDELVEILRRENAVNLFVATVPLEFRYVRYIVIVTGKSVRHMSGMAEYIRRVFKYKRHETDAIPMIEGKKSREWIALDLGNIALHIFSSEAREYYDLETLWSVGKEFDDRSKQSDAEKLIQEYTVNLIPADTESENKVGTQFNNVKADSNV